MSKELYNLNKLDNYRWEIPDNYKHGMKVTGIVYADDAMLELILQDRSLEQVANVSTLPGIAGHSLAMPDIHWGYGFPIGGVAATEINNGVISPGGVGYDINCGVRLLSTNLTEDEVRPKLKELVDSLFYNIPSGLGSQGRIKTSEKEINEVMSTGAKWAVKQGYGTTEDLEFTEESGCISGADPIKVSKRAKQRGSPQLGTLGSGNHFIEIQVISDIYDKEIARSFGIMDTGQVVVLIHTGSRGLGHQVCDDYLRVMSAAVSKYNISLPDRQLACAPVQSTEGKDYLAAMACAANYAWANRQCIAHWTRDSFQKTFGKSADNMGMRQIYDVAHNIAKIENHVREGKKQKYCVHRKGATRAFPAGHPDIPEKYKNAGQPVLIPGDMGRCSYIAVGTEKALAESFGSTCHGAGRVLSRGEAKRSKKGKDVIIELELKGITVRAHNINSLSEEASHAYKDVDRVIDIAHNAGISKKIARAIPLAVIKG